MVFSKAEEVAEGTKVPPSSALPPQSARICCSCACACTRTRTLTRREPRLLKGTNQLDKVGFSGPTRVRVSEPLSLGAESQSSEPSLRLSFRVEDFPDPNTGTLSA